MTPLSTSTPVQIPADCPAHGEPHVYPIETFLKIQTLMRKLKLTPADCLGLLAEVLEDFDSQAAEYEEAADGLPF